MAQTARWREKESDFRRTVQVKDSPNPPAVVVADFLAHGQQPPDGAAPPVFARGITPNSCMKNGPGKVGLPIVCGGVAVQDLVALAAFDAARRAHNRALLADRKAGKITAEELENGWR